MIGNSKILLQIDFYQLSRTVSFHCLHFNSVCLLRVEMMVVLDFILDPKGAGLKIDKISSGMVNFT
jgi:hypothetical protein